MIFRWTRGSLPNTRYYVAPIFNALAGGTGGGGGGGGAVVFTGFITLGRMGLYPPPTNV